MKITTLENGLKFYVRDSYDEAIINEVFNEKIYQQQGFNANPEDIIIDIGAHIGTFSLLFSQKAKKVFSFEPAGGNYAELLKNIGLNGIQNIIPHQSAVLGKEGTHTLFLHEAGYSHSFFEKSGHAIQAKSTTLEHIFKEHHIEKCDLLKIDAEGSEYDIIFNAPPGCLKKINRIILEYHQNTDRQGLKKMVRFLTKNHFRISKIKPKKDVPKIYGVLFAKQSTGSPGMLTLVNYSAYIQSIAHGLLIAYANQADAAIGKIGIRIKKQHPNLYRWLQKIVPKTK